MRRLAEAAVREPVVPCSPCNEVADSQFVFSCRMERPTVSAAEATVVSANRPPHRAGGK